GAAMGEWGGRDAEHRVWGGGGDRGETEDVDRAGDRLRLREGTAVATLRRPVDEPAGAEFGGEVGDAADVIDEGKGIAEQTELRFTEQDGLKRRHLEAL